ncbi:MAG: UDP-4-amino-4,6-dideoxy-N-acetyl-beta-L-altrosamine transaminase [Verrucomicrobia bacterium Tous-C9LFEB]|nr:MAG: UDP-4-amino-4,6-dideoxy-N-acetyl-beta-L-altrosamine transaminase [Verrucomicrobia bacterium Tous-C9LFEB]
MAFLPYGRQFIDIADLQAVSESLQSDYLTTGPEVERFEKDLADFLGVKHAIAVNSCTSALHIAMLAAGIKTGDRVITTPNTFLASANCAAYVGARPDFADIDPQTYNLSATALEKKMGPDVRAVVAVDFAGQTPDMPRIAEIARRQGAVVIEDACHAIGTEFEEQGKRYRVGNHPWADISAFSFHPVKTMTTGEGGFLATNNDDYAAASRLIRSHGVVRQTEAFQGLGRGAEEFGPWYYEMQSLGYNFRITDFQCALGRSQLKKLPGFIRRRQEIVAAYNEAFRDLPHFKTPQAHWPTLTSWHLYVAQIDFKAIGTTRTTIMQALRDQGIGTQVHYIPVHLQPYYRQTYGTNPGDYPMAEAYYDRCLSLPLYPGLTEDDVQRVIKAVRDVVK